MTDFNEVILLKYGELILKGLNKSRFENQLLNDLAKKIKKVGEYKITKAQSTVYVFPQDEDAAEDIGKAYEECKKVFGIVALCRACEVEKDMDVILKTLPEYIKPKMEKSRTFKVETKRSDKHFPLQSPEISKLCGGAILSRFPHLKVDVENPDVVVRVEIRDFGAYLHCGTEDGAGGMPKHQEAAFDALKEKGVKVYIKSQCIYGKVEAIYEAHSGVNKFIPVVDTSIDWAMYAIMFGVI